MGGFWEWNFRNISVFDSQMTVVGEILAKVKATTRGPRKKSARVYERLYKVLAMLYSPLMVY